MIHASRDGKGIVWLASYPKSGNTWLRVFLYHLVRQQVGAPREDDELNKLERASIYEGRLAGLFTEFLRKPVEGASMEDVAAIRSEVQAAIVKRSTNLALVKTHNCLADLFGFPLINLGMTVGGVYMVRDPRDIAPSLAHHLGVDIDEAIRVMGSSGFATANGREGPFEVWGSWTQHVSSWTAAVNPALLVVRYEDLIADPVAKFTEITAHLRIEASAAAIAEATDLATFDKLSAAERLNPFKETSEVADRFFREGRAGVWRERLTPEQADAIVAANAAEMQRFGYLAG